jgi:hypothetical protein
VIYIADSIHVYCRRICHGNVRVFVLMSSSLVRVSCRLAVAADAVGVVRRGQGRSTLIRASKWP